MGDPDRPNASLMQPLDTYATASAHRPQHTTGSSETRIHFVGMRLTPITMRFVLNYLSWKLRFTAHPLGCKRPPRWRNAMSELGQMTIAILLIQGRFNLHAAISYYYRMQDIACLC